MNGVKKKIRHVLDSEIAKKEGKLTPQQMYEVVKKYETYVACNKRLEGKGTSSSASQQKATGHTSGYKPQFYKTTAFAAMIAESENNAHHHQESSPQEEADSFGAESSQEDDEGLFIPSYLEEALPDDPTLQVKMAMPSRPRKWRPGDALPVTSQVIFRRTIGNMRKKMGLGPYSQRGLPKTSQLKSGQSQNPLSQVK